LKPIILVVGTRAEAIKLIPLFLELKKEKINALLCGTFQHSDMLDQVCKIFDVIPDFNLNVMRQGQDLFYLNTVILQKTKEVYLKEDPALILVHGDTTTTMAAAMSAFYLHIPIGHIEAGLRTGNMQSPFPEEMNRKVVGQIADYHFAPTAFSTANLLSEGVKRERVFCTGNTIVDALFWMKEKIEKNQIEIDEKIKSFVKKSKADRKKIILLTAHRRESFGGGLKRIFEAIKKFASDHENVYIFFPVHPNPNVSSAVKESGIENIKNIFICGPLYYKELVYLLLNVNFVATDSGGIQEEAVSLGKRVLVLRDVTERWEGVWDGSEKLVGTDTDLILTGLNEFYNLDTNANIESSIYGDGNACKRIVNILKSKFNL